MWTGPAETLELGLILSAQHGMHWRQGRFFARKLGIEPACIAWIFKRWTERRGDTFVEHVVPIDIGEEGMCLDLVCIGRACAQPASWIAREEFFQDRDGICRHVQRIQRFVFQNRVKDLVLVIAGSSARMALGCADRPVDAAIAGIVDEVDMPLVTESR